MVYDIWKGTVVYFLFFILASNSLRLLSIMRSRAKTIINMGNATFQLIANKKIIEITISTKYIALL